MKNINMSKPNNSKKIKIEQIRVFLQQGKLTLGAVGVVPDELIKELKNINVTVVTNLDNEI
jgi:hypothetical protein